MSRGSMVACRCGPGRYSDRNSGPAVRPAIRRGSRCAVSVPHVIHMVSPPLTVTRACLLDRSRSRSSTFRASTAPAREADSYSIRHKNFSKIAEPSRVAPCLPATSPSSSPTRVQRSINSSSSALNVEDLDLDLSNKQARVTVKGGDTMWITWGTDTAHLLPRLIAGRTAGPLFLSEYRPGRHRQATIDPRDICPETSRARLGYDRARILLGHYGDGLRLHQLRHSAATHLGEAGIDATVIMAKTGHKSLRTLQRYVRPGLTAVHQATESLSSPRRRG